jgi:hypothetical protein
MQAWPLFFSSTWGRFERRLSSLITSIEKISALIDKQTTTFHILEVKEWRRKSLEDFNTLEARRTAEQWQAVLNWLGTEVQAQKDKLDWLNARSHEGTSTWIVNHNKFRSWLQRGRGSPVVWIHGKPGSGKFAMLLAVLDQLYMLMYSTRQVCPGITGRIIYHYHPKEQRPSPVFLLQLPDTSSSGHDSDLQSLSSSMCLPRSRHSAVSL